LGRVRTFGAGQGPREARRHRHTSQRWQSNHNYGLAVDLCPFVDGKPQWNDNSGFIGIGAEAARHGLEWGGSWKKFIDKPHVQLPGHTVSQCLRYYNKGGLKNVWAHVPDLP
jgi:peptidoglycan L-alanyl-D-glutamate endopeptidase CwlK